VTASNALRCSKSGLKASLVGFQLCDDLWDVQVTLQSNRGSIRQGGFRFRLERTPNPKMVTAELKARRSQEVIQVGQPGRATEHLPITLPSLPITDRLSPGMVIALLRNGDRNHPGIVIAITQES
jgi:hypothetical protein